MQQHVVDPVGVKRHVHLLGQLLRLLLRPAPQRFDGEALILQQRDDHPGGQAGAEHADPWKHGAGLFVWSGALCFRFVLTDEARPAAAAAAEREGSGGWDRQVGHPPAVKHPLRCILPSLRFYDPASNILSLFRPENDPETDLKPNQASAAL